jgi:hypothetical protein
MYLATKPSNRARLCRAFVIGADHGTQIFGIELVPEPGRADDIGEHNGELTPFGVVPWLGSGGCKLRRDGHGSAGDKRADGRLANEDGPRGAASC